jgi:ABC-type sugar transport system permease subunit
VQSTSTLSFEAFQNGFEYFHYGYASAIAYVMVIVAAIGVTVLLRFVRVRQEEFA